MKLKGIPIEERKKASSKQGYIAVQRFNKCKGCVNFIYGDGGYPSQRCGIGNFAVSLHGICNLWEIKKDK